MKTRATLLVLFALLFATEARAQWDVPSFLPPRPGDDVGAYVSSIKDVGFQGIWRQQGNLNLGLRVGYIDTRNDGAISLGAESWGLLLTAPAEFPVDVAWTLGLGAIINGGTQFAVPAGLTIGRSFDVEGLRLQVYGHPRIALVVPDGGEPDPPFGDGGDDVEIDGQFDLGLDAVLNRNLKFRVGISLGETDAVGVGLAIPFRRGAVVR